MIVPPSIIASITATSLLIQAYTGWSLLISIVVAIVPGVIVGMLLGFLLSVGISALFFYFNQKDV